MLLGRCSGYITVANLTDLLGADVPKSHLAEIIDEADIKRDKRISYEEFLALWDEEHDARRRQALEDVKRRRLLNSNSLLSAVSSSVSALLSPEREEVLSDISGHSDHGDAVSLFQREKAKSVRLFADV